MNNFLDVIETLENDERFKYFIVDGQTSLLDDYTSMRPQDKNRIVKLVKNGRLIIGPWYTQSDQMLISGESIIRNLQQGIRTALEYGDYQKVGYVPDSFGQSGAMPQIYNEFNINRTLFWRGSTDEMSRFNEFYWCGNDGSKVLAVQIPNGYYIGGSIPEEGKDAIEFWKSEAIDKAGKRTNTSNIFFPNGFDQAPIRKNLPDIIESQQKRDPDNKYFISNISKYFDSVVEENEDFETINGELTYAKHSRIHKSIFSSRSDIKAMNTILQNYLVNIMEPLLIIADSLGFTYPQELVDRIWKIMLQNAAHDAIGSCVSDEANYTIMNRYLEVKDLSENLVDLYQRKIAMHIVPKEGLHIILFNCEPYKVSKVITYEGFVPYESFIMLNNDGEEIDYLIVEEEDMTNYVLSNRIQLNPSKEIEVPKKVRKVKMIFQGVDLPAMGYTTYRIIEAQEKKGLEFESHKKSIENDTYVIEVNEKGSIDITIKKDGKKYKNQAVIIDNGDAGDSFDYSPPQNDFKVKSTDCEFKYKIRSSQIIKELEIEYTFILPFDLEERANKQSTTKQTVTLLITLDNYSEYIRFNFNTHNTVLSHRMVIEFDTNIISKMSIADHQFGTIQRPVYYTEAMDSYYKYERKDFHLDKIRIEAIPLANQVQNTNGWQQPTIAIEPTQSFVALSDKNSTVTVIPQGVREYEIVGDSYSIISLTLFRTYGQMGKENLIYRPGRASGETTIKTPDAQLLKELQFDFYVGYFCESFDSLKIAQNAKSVNTPIQSYGYAEFLNGRLYFSQYPIDSNLQFKYSLLTLSDDSVFSSITKSHNKKDAYLLRVYNGYLEKNSRIELSVNYDCNIQQVNLLGDPKETIKDILESNKFITYEIDIKNKE